MGAPASADKTLQAAFDQGTQGFRVNVVAGGSGGGVASQVQGDTAQGAAWTSNPFGMGAKDGAGLMQPAIMTGTGGVQVNPDGLNRGDDNSAATLASPYFAQQTYTSPSGGETTITFSFAMLDAGPTTPAIKSFEFGIENKSGQTINAMTIAGQDTIGTTNNATMGTYQVFNTPPTAVNTAPTLSITNNNESNFEYPVVRKGGFRTWLVTLTLAAGMTTAGTIKIQLKANPHFMPIGASYIVFNNVQGVAAQTAQTLLAAMGANVRTCIRNITASNDGSGSSRLTVQWATSTTVFWGGKLAATAGALAKSWGDIGLACDALNRVVQYTTSSASGAVDIFIEAACLGG